MCFEFPFNLIRKSTMPFLTRKSWCVLKSWFTSGTGISVVFSSFQSCRHNFKTFGLKIIPLFVFITCESTAVGIEHSVKRFCWGRRTHNSQFARKIFPLLYNNKMFQTSTQYPVLFSLFLFVKGLFQFFNGSFCRDRTKIGFVHWQFFPSQTPRHRPAFQQQIEAPDWFLYISIVY